ncbi:hypothetical protein MATR_02720 [Marivirga tractuosa]|jgi:hypothetical protein|uniref:Uncharacterized protein n=1 Tax=Marivirga tractuosa (strain ATCC 23168 / DSM 4126 / NBRC 15989 / NCIMB 1408 / VKM B-1430 / H-43) TaxID=643867 RepID=E4TUH3_MARTH|nr:hypothetical protein [Marivirga tractuosa]ADR22091.1 hypothetical protein Ftrac_2109 [Marivirga tractuosa DSM 4126]BDD13447.1 hypothetical protein MATR_02720 [Marivirga tractuosa]|tara:strand:+ start:87326 stop:87748 length:423 start_codon:yes stop_codon:yes gene_type:complete
MKTTKIILTAVMGLSISLYSCNDDDMQNKLSEDDIVALEGFREAYTRASDANLELKGSIQQGDFDGIHFHDSVFHHYEGLFEEHHEDYSHSNDHDDHHHDADGMHMGSNAMNGHDQGDGHHDDDHQSMDDLMDDHETSTH